MSSGKAETRRAILDAALELFEERGPAVARMADIATRAGVTRQALYLHFGSRTGLLVALVQYVDETGPLRELVQPVWEAARGIEALERFVGVNAAYNPHIYPIVKALLANRYADEAIAAAWEDRMAGRRGACRRLIRWLERDGALDSAWDVDEATDLLWALTGHQLWEQLVIDRQWPADRYERHLRGLLRRTFTRRET